MHQPDFEPRHSDAWISTPRLSTMKGQSRHRLGGLGWRPGSEPNPKRRKCVPLTGLHQGTFQTGSRAIPGQWHPIGHGLFMCQCEKRGGTDGQQEPQVDPDDTPHHGGIPRRESLACPKPDPPHIHLGSPAPPYTRLTPAGLCNRRPDFYSP